MDHLSRLSFEDCTTSATPIQESFPNEQLLAVTALAWYTDIVNYLVTGETPSQWFAQDRKKFLLIVRHFYFEDPYLFKYCADQVVQRCVSKEEISLIWVSCYSEVYRGHF